MPPIWIALAMQYMQKQQEDRAAREAARLGIAEQHARDLGAPTYGITAAKTLRGIEDSAGTSYVQMFGNMYGGGGAFTGAGNAAGRNPPPGQVGASFIRDSPY